MSGAENNSRVRLIQRSVIAALILVTLVTLWRGTVPGDLRLPSSQKDGVTCALVAESDGTKPVRCAILIPASLSEVADALADFSRYPELFKTRYWWVSSSKLGRMSNDGAEIEGRLEGSVFSFDFSSTVHFARDGEKWSATWKDAGGSLDRNRGSWLLSPSSPHETLVVYSLDIGVSPVPSFLVRNCLLSVLPGMMNSLSNSLGR